MELDKPIDLQLKTEAMFVRWSEITVDKLHQALDKYGIGTLDGPLWQSITQAVVKANGNADKVVLKFLQYGRFRDMRVGRANKIGNPGKRKKAPWFSKTYYIEVQKLQTLYAAEFNKQIPVAIQEALTANINLNA